LGCNMPKRGKRNFPPKFTQIRIFGFKIYIPSGNSGWR
jgi:hypothetical protein